MGEKRQSIAKWPIEINIKIYESGDHIVYMKNKSLLGIGDSCSEALRDLIDTIKADYRFFVNTPDVGLTNDAVYLKNELIALFKMLPEVRI